jgi:hypothetical protein
MRNAHILVEKPEGKNPLNRPRRRWAEKYFCEDADWIHVAKDRDQWRDFVKTVMKLLVP